MTNAEKYLKDEVDLEEFAKSIMTWYFGNYAKANDFARIKNWAEHKIETPTEDEKVILRNIDNKAFKTLGRNKKGCLYLRYYFQDESEVCCLKNNLFQFIEERRRISYWGTIKWIK